MALELLGEDAPLQGPAWNNSSEYPSLASNEFTHDRATVDTLVRRIRDDIEQIRPAMDKALSSTGVTEDERRHLALALQGISEVFDQASVLVMNLSTYASCELSVDSRNEEANRVLNELVVVGSELDSAQKPFDLFLRKAPESIVKAYLDHPHTRPEEFSVRQARLDADIALSEAEETLATQLKTFGPSAWGSLYERVSGQLQCRVERPDGSSETMGLAKAAGLLRDVSEPVRRAAWHAIQDAWKTHEESGAAVLNGLAGWRLEMARRRSARRPVGFLDAPLKMNRIEARTLDAMMSAIQSRIEVPRRAMRIMARATGKACLDPWDLLADAPLTTGGRRPFKEGLEMVKSALHAASPEMGDFVSTMAKNRWIEGRVLPAKAQGAFCTRFEKSRTPRVYQTYMGSVSDIRTLAHELGHAYHAWVMRDLPRVLHEYPMTLAETASIFAETAFAEHVATSGSQEGKFEIAWQNASAAAGFLLNIPSRFEFERSFYERRKSAFVSPKELGDLTEAAWQKWYGDTLTMPDRQFWMSKMHFSFAELSFYNFPYAFGYLFSLGLYARGRTAGRDFASSYVSLLRDTGRMTAEELVKAHLGEDITEPAFWLASLDIVERQVAELEALVGARETVRYRQ